MKTVTVLLGNISMAQTLLLVLVGSHI